MTASRLLVVALAALLASSWAATAHAGDDGARTVAPPLLRGGTADLLPFDDLQRGAFNREHGPLLYRIQKLERDAARLTRQYGDRKNPKTYRKKPVADEARRLRIRATALRHRLTEAVLEAGVDGALIAYMNHAPRGPGRLERYAHGLVLLGDLAPGQRALFDRIVDQVDAAYLAIAAQKERSLLALKQTQLDQGEQTAVARTFDRQLAVIDQRFWMLVDFVLDRDQRFELWQRLPSRLKRKSQAVEHLYQLPDLTPSQGTRLRAVMTELEHEASPDRAAVRRLQASGRDRKLSTQERQAAARERAEAARRLGELQRFAAEATREILTEAQWREYQAIPPRLSVNERSGNYRRVFQDFEPSAAQREKMNQLQKAQRERARVYRQRLAELRREGADYGADSPQMMGMQMEMAGARAESAAAGRAYIGAMFTQVLTPAQVTQWVMGHWGYKR